MKLDCRHCLGLDPRLFREGGLHSCSSLAWCLDVFLAAVAAALFSAAVPLAALLAERATGVLDPEREWRLLPPEADLCRLPLISGLPGEGIEGDLGKLPPLAAVWYFAPANSHQTSGTSITAVDSRQLAAEQLAIGIDVVIIDT